MTTADLSEPARISSASFGPNGVCVGAFAGKDANYIAYLMYRIDGNVLHPVQVSNSMGLRVQNQNVTEIGGCETNKEGVCFVYDANKGLGDFSAHAYAQPLKFAYTVTVASSEASKPSDAELRKAEVSLLVGTRKVFCAYAGNSAFSCTFSTDTCADLDITTQVRAFVEMDGFEAYAVDAKTL